MYNPPGRAASSFLSIKSPNLRKLLRPSTLRRLRARPHLTCWPRRFSSIIAKIIFERVATWRLPAIYEWPEMAEGEGLLGYGPRIVQIYRDLVSRQVVKVLRGIKPADIPVEQPTRFELVINLKAARAIRHEVPAGLVLRADKLIEG